MSYRVVCLVIVLGSIAFAQDRAAVRKAEDTCGPRDAKFAISGDKSQHPTPGPEPGKARVYLLGDASYGVDGQWVGSVKRTYSSISLDPGMHHVCSRYSHWVPFYIGIVIPVKITHYSLHSLDAKEGEAYYFEFPQGMNWELTQLDSDEGARRVAAAKYSTSRRK